MYIRLWAELPFWQDLYHIRQFWYQIVNPLENCFQMINVSFYLSELPFVASPILYYVILISDWASAQKRLQMIYIIIFGWITILAPSIPYQNVNLLENCIVVSCRPSSNPEWKSTLPHLASTKLHAKSIQILDYIVYPGTPRHWTN